MVIDSRQELSLAEKIVYSAAGPIGNLKYNSVRKHYAKEFCTLEQICREANIESAQINRIAKERLNRTISGIYRAGSRFIKDCICVQLYEDGDGVMKWAYEHGAVACVVRREISGLPCIVSDDPAEVYADMCAYFRRRNSIKATTIMGSIGKTTTKKMVNSVYSTQYKTFCDAGNDNQIDGVGYFAQHIPANAEKWIQEVSEDTPGYIRSISAIALPSVNIVTAIDMSHIQEYGSKEGILEEIRSAEAGMSDETVIITSMDQEDTFGLFGSDRNVIYVSVKNEDADYSAMDIRVENDGLHFVVHDRKTQKDHPVFLKNVFAKHNVYSALYAFAAGVCSGVDHRNIIKGLAAYKTNGIRQNVYKARGIIVYADCYNAVAKSIRSAAEACDEIPVSGKRIAVIGDVEETGEYSKDVHKEIVDIINDSRFDVLFTFGERMAEAVKLNAHSERIHVESFTDRSKLNAAVKKAVKRGDLILFKASHKSRLDKCIASVFPAEYLKKTVEYAVPQVAFRWKVLKSWTL